MKDIFFRLLVAAALTLAAFALLPSAHGQQADEDATPTNPTAPGRAQQSPASSETQTRRSDVSSSPSDQTQDELAFTGRIEQQKGSLWLKDPVTKLNYQLDDQQRAKKFIGKAVKVKGKLDMKSNTIQVSSIEPIT
jgi:Protein of unknown function (DUF5818)